MPTRSLRALLSVLAMLAPVAVSLSPGPVAADTPAQKAQFRHWGHTSAPDRVLRAGCHMYHYHYRLTPPTQDWGMEAFLIDAAGNHLGSGVFVSGADPVSGQGGFRICQANTTVGKFRIEGRLLLADGEEHSSGPITTSHFRLTSRH